MAFLGVKVPHEIGDLLEQFEVPGEREPKHKYHITVHNFGSEVPIDQIGTAALVAYAVTRQTKPFTVTTRLVSSFDAGDDGAPVIARVESPGLHQLWTRLGAAFDAAGVEYSKRFPEYKPHITLAYAPEAMPDTIIPSVTWTVSDVVLWGGDEGEKRIVVKLPLEMNFDVAAALRVASRYQVACEGGVCTCGGTCTCGKRTP